MAFVGPAAHARDAIGKALTGSNFQLSAPHGFGDRNNTEAQSMAWWHNHLFVGTDRDAVCVSDFAIWDYIAGTVSLSFANSYLPYPPSDPDLSCPFLGADLSIQAEIWSWTPSDNTWTRVFQSPLALDNPGSGGAMPYPPQAMIPAGAKLPYEIAVRGLAPFTEPDGTEALYAFTVNSDIMWDGTKLPLPRILRTTDGVNWAPIPQTPGTFLGDLPFTADHSSYRSPVSFKGKLFVLCGTVEGNGSLIASDDPAKGDNAWFLASPPGMQFYDVAAFNGWLYLGGFTQINGFPNQSLGYTVLKTRAEGTPPYELITVVPTGAYVTNMPSDSVVSMHEYQGRLYVGTDYPTEVIRINPDDSWDLVVGTPRAVPLPNGGSEMKYPLSGLDAGWDNTLNSHAWWMEDFDKHLYIGTYNASTGFRLDPVAAPLLAHMGANLYRSRDGGWYYSAVTTTGFANPSDPYGGIFDYGIRTMAATPYGLFLGTANDYYGLSVFLGTPSPPVTPEPPHRVEMEPLKNGSALLSWDASAGAKQYEIWRAERNPIMVRSNLVLADYTAAEVADIEDLNFTAGTSVPDVYVGAYQQIGVTKDTVFVDSTVQSGQPYMYYVLADSGSAANNSTSGSITIFDPGLGAVLGTAYDPSDQSNLVAFPLITPSVTFAQLLQEVDTLDQRQRFKDPATQLTPLRNMIVNAQRLAMNCRISAAISALDPPAAYGEVLEPEATDLEILIAKLVRRLQLFNRFPNQVISTEFCNLS